MMKNKMWNIGYTTAIIMFLMTMGTTDTFAFQILGKEEIEHEEEIKEDRVPNFRFRWAFGAAGKKASDYKVLSIKGDTTVSRQDHFKIYVELFQSYPCYVYVIRRQNDKVQLLFPYSLRQYLVTYKPGRYYIPKSRKWLSLEDGTDQETYYLLASRNRLMKLESLLMRYVMSTEEEQKIMAVQIQSEIQKSIKHRTPREQPVERLAKYTGIPKEKKEMNNINRFAIDISAVDFYWKSFTLSAGK